MSDSPVDDDDDALMAVYARGEAAAFERLYTRHRLALYRFVRRLLGSANAAQVDEVFQDTGCAWCRRARAGSRRARASALAVHARAPPRHRPAAQERREVALDATRAKTASPGNPRQAAGSTGLRRLPATLQGDELAFWRRAGEKPLARLDELPLAQRSAFLLHHDDGLRSPTSRMRSRSASRPPRRGCATRWLLRAAAWGAYLAPESPR